MRKALWQPTPIQPRDLLNDFGKAVTDAVAEDKVAVDAYIEFGQRCNQRIAAQHLAVDQDAVTVENDEVDRHDPLSYRTFNRQIRVSSTPGGCHESKRRGNSPRRLLRCLCDDDILSGSEVWFIPKGEMTVAQNHSLSVKPEGYRPCCLAPCRSLSASYVQ